ncbi:MAG: DUF2019 domain-containing protein [Clostridia bacterium]|nr:DUF2019 domain-containing protein [Clostridia bacterium]
MDLVEKYLMLVNEMAEFNSYDDKKEVAKYNKKTTKIREIASAIEKEQSELKIAFCQLLSNENPTIRLWVAHHMLEVMNYEDCYRKKALQEIKQRAKDKTADGYGNKLWLKEWYKDHPKDRLL